MKPGTSTKVTSGIWKASQKRTKRAALRLASMSSTPARARGWLATTPTGMPSMRPKPVTMFLAKPSEISKKSASSTVFAISSLMS